MCYTHKNLALKSVHNVPSLNIAHTRTVYVLHIHKLLLNFFFHGQPSLSYRIRVYTLPYAAIRLLLTKITLLTLFGRISCVIVCDFRSLKTCVFRLIYLKFCYRRLFWEKFDAHLNCKTLQNKTNETKRIEPQIKR